MKKIITTIICVVLVFAFAGSAMAYSNGIQGGKVYGGNAKIVVNSGSVQRKTAPDQNVQITIYDSTNFNTEANISFRAYKEDSSSALRSNRISFYLTEYYNGQMKTGPYINGGAAASYLDLRASIPNSNATAYAVFYGWIRM